MAPLKSQAESLMKQMQEAITVIEYIFNEQTQQDIVESFANIKKTFANLQRSSVDLDSLMGKQKNRIDHILTNIELITRNLNQQERNISSSLKNISDITDSLANSDLKQTIYEIQFAMVELKQILAKVNSGQGTIGQLMNNDSLYVNLEQLTYDITILSEDLRTNPKRYTHFSAFDFGKKVYVADDGKPIKGRLVYKIVIVRSEQRIEIKPNNFKGYENVQEIEMNGSYLYLFGTKSKLTKAQELLIEVKKDFPNASIIELKGGKVIRANLE
jgi:phospholipid/cholesterol/gamma-HCH transport system substrate-binding protein